MAHERLTDERLEELYERALAERGAPARADCVSPEAILALIRREGPEARRLETLGHVMSCAACRAEFDLLRAIERAGEQTGAVGAPASRSWATRRWRPAASLALAASVLLAVAVGVWQRVGANDRADVERGASDAVALVAPSADAVASAPVRFVWHAVPRARRYELEVLDAAGTPVYAVATTDTIATLANVGRLRAGAEYRWWVRVTDDAGVQRVSPMRRLRAPGD
jgi:hypothetical protein